MLPIQRPPSALEYGIADGKPWRGYNRIALRWAVLICTVILGLWVAIPIVRELVLLHTPDFDIGYYIPSASPHEQPPPPTSPISLDEQRERAMWVERKARVRRSFQHAWNGYRTHAFLSDELLPVSLGKIDNFNGWGVTIYDSLDTMWIMGLHDEFSDAVKSISDQQFNSTKPDNFSPFFETVIRYLGGTLSAYALSKDNALLELAERLGQVLLPAFNGTETGLPGYSVNVQTGEINYEYGRRSVLFAEAASCQLEFKYLAKLTGKKEYYDRAQAAMDVIYKMDPVIGLYPDRIYTDNGSTASTHLTVGAMADSGYEYMLKQWILSGDEKARDQYTKSANGIIHNLIHVTSKRGLMYVGDYDTMWDSVIHRLEHLSCFLPGTLALGVKYLDLSPELRELHQWAAEGIAYTCYLSYAEQRTGLGPEVMNMVMGGNKWIAEVGKWKAHGSVGKPPGLAEPVPELDANLREYIATDPRYLLRPETVESLFYLWRLTGDVKWRHRGWEIFQAIERHTRTLYGYGSVYGVDSMDPSTMDEMPSFFLAETLKYLYLLFDDVENITLDEWVFNTEAHPLPKFSWTKEESRKFNITV